MATQAKKTTAKKSTAKNNAKDTKTIKEPQRISKTGLAFREAIKDPWFKVNDWRAVNK